MPKSPPLRERLRDYLLAALAEPDPVSVLASLNQLAAPDPYRFRVKVLYSASSPPEVLRSALGADTGLFAVGKGGFGFRYVDLRSGASAEERTIPFLVTTPEGWGVGAQVAAVVSICTRHQWKALNRFLDWRYPDLAPILLSQGELIASATRLRSFAGHDVQVRSFTAKEREQTTERTILRSVREWTEEGLENVIESVTERNQTLTSLELEFYPRIDQFTYVVPKAACKIRKKGEIELTGSLDLVLRSVGADIARVGERKLRFLSRRGVLEAGYKPRPLSITFGSPIFDDLAEVRRVVSILRDFPKSMHAVEHGNPYAQVRITDTRDSSAFEIWVIPPSKIAPLPGFWASEAAFERLVHYLFDRFREGELADYVT